MVGRSSVISIDASSTERRTRAYLATIESVSPAPVKMLVNTHHHGDHTYGNSLFSGATIVAHENCRAELIAFGPPADRGIWEPVEWGDLRWPRRRSRSPTGCGCGPTTARWKSASVGQPAHTSNDSLVWLPEQGVLFCGDLLFNGGTPFLLMGSVRGAIEVLTSVVAPIPATVIVPGHGAPCDHGLIDVVTRYLKFVLDTAAKGIEAGLPPLELARATGLGEYAGWLDRERIVGNLHRAYADLGAGRRGGPHRGAAGHGRVHGGQPLSCYA